MIGGCRRAAGRARGCDTSVARVGRDHGVPRAPGGRGRAARPGSGGRPGRRGVREHLVLGRLLRREERVADVSRSSSPASISTSRTVVDLGLGGHRPADARCGSRGWSSIDPPRLTCGSGGVGHGGRGARCGVGRAARGPDGAERRTPAPARAPIAMAERGRPADQGGEVGRRSATGSTSRPTQAERRARPACARLARRARYAGRTRSRRRRSGPSGRARRGWRCRPSRRTPGSPGPSRPARRPRGRPARTASGSARRRAARRAAGGCARRRPGSAPALPRAKK